jgi:uncharacterized protein
MIAPVKGLALVTREAVELTADGVAEDRRFFLVDERDTMINGKRCGPLATVTPTVGDRLTLRFPDGSSVEGPIDLGAPLAARFFGRPRDVRLVEGPFSAALSAFAGRSLRLVEPTSPAMDRGRRGAFSLLSVAALNGFDPRRFRMLFGVDGVPAHAEDDWIGGRVRIGEAIVRPLSETGRCLITSQDPDTGVADTDMLGWIRATRPLGTGEPLPFGVHGAVAQAGTVRLGDSVEPL